MAQISLFPYMQAQYYLPFEKQLEWKKYTFDFYKTVTKDIFILLC